MEGVGATLGEVWAEAIATDVLHFVFVWERGDGIVGEFGGKGFVKPDKIGEAAADGCVRFGERSELGLEDREMIS